MKKFIHFDDLTYILGNLIYHSGKKSNPELKTAYVPLFLTHSLIIRYTLPHCVYLSQFLSLFLSVPHSEGDYNLQNEFTEQIRITFLVDHNFVYENVVSLQLKRNKKKKSIFYIIDKKKSTFSFEAILYISAYHFNFFSMFTESTSF